MVGGDTSFKRWSGTVKEGIFEYSNENLVHVIFMIARLQFSWMLPLVIFDKKVPFFPKIVLFEGICG